MPYFEGSYSTIALVKQQLGITDASEDANLTALIEQVSRVFDSVTLWPVGQQSLTEYYSGDGTRSLFLDHQPSEVASERQDPDLLVVENDVSISTAETGGSLDVLVKAYPERELIRMSGPLNVPVFDKVWPVGILNIRVDYKTRFAVTPKDVEVACTEESARHFYLQNSGTGVEGRQIGVSNRAPEVGTSQTFTDDDLSPSTLRILRFYREEHFV